MKKKLEYITADKYEEDYQKPDGAFALGMLMTAGWVIFNIAPPAGLTPADWYLYTLPLRIVATIWSANIAKNQNRGAFDWGLLGFFLPAVTLIIISRLRKLKLSFKVNTSYPPEVQYRELKDHADKLIRKSKANEARYIYEYIIMKLPHTIEDKERLKQLKSQVAA